MSSSSGRRRRVVPALLVAVVAAVVVGVLLGTSSSGPRRAAPFSLPRLGGGAPVTVPVTGSGHQVPVVLTFFASWCGPCHADLPVVARVERQLAAAGSPVVFVGIDGNDDPATGLAFARSSGVRFAVGKDRLSAVAPRYGLPGYPATVFIDRAGEVVDEVRGPVSAATLRTWAARIARPG